MKEIDLQEKLCQKFCSYYKPSKNEALSCKGFAVVKKMVEKGKKISFRKYEKKLDVRIQELLQQAICITCPFYENDCDFVQKHGKALPCGGFIFLGQLIQTNCISIDNIEGIR